MSSEKKITKSVKKFFRRSDEISSLKYVAAIILLGVSLFSGSFAAKNILSSDEFVRIGNMSNMAARGNFVEPMLGNLIHTENSTLHTALGGIFGFLFGESIFAFVLPSIIAAIMLMVLCFFIARSFGLKKISAFSCSVMLGCSSTFFLAAQQMTVYMFSELWLLLSLWSFQMFLSSNTFSKRWLFFVVAVIAGTILTLSASFSAIALVGIPLFVLCLSYDFVDDCLRIKRYMLLGICAFLVAGAYLGYLFFLNWQSGYFLAYHIGWSSNVFAIRGPQSNPEGIGFWYDYLIVSYRFFLPFLPLFLLALVYDIKLYRKNKDKNLLFLLVIFFVLLVILQVTPWKPEKYLLILAPPAALLTIYGIENYLTALPKRRQYYRFAAISGKWGGRFLPLAGGIIIIRAFYSEWLYSQENFSTATTLIIFGCLLVYSGIMAIIGFNRNDFQLNGRFLLLGVTLLYSTFFAWGSVENIEQNSELKLIIPLNKILKSHYDDPDLAVLMVQPPLRGALRFYYGREIPELNDYYWPLDKEITVVTLVHNYFINRFQSKLDVQRVKVYPLAKNEVTGNCSIVFLRGKLPDLLPTLNLLFDGENRKLINQYNDTAIFYSNLQ